MFGLSCFSGFLKLEPKFFIGGDDFEISFEFKTDQLNSLLLFAYDINGEDFILVSFSEKNVRSEFILPKSKV